MEALISRKESSPDFSHTNWGDDDLLILRQKIRNFYRKEQKLCCVYCDNPISAISPDGAHIEHIVPKSLYKDFIFTPVNLCVICPDCNQCKSNNEVLQNPLKRTGIKKYPRSSGAFKIVHPHFDVYSDHIIKAHRIYVDLTPKGHWTIGACKLNRFYHLFGVCDEFLDDTNIIRSNENFHESQTLPSTLSSTSPLL